MRTAKTFLLLALAALLAAPAAGCRSLVRDSFRSPRARLVAVEPPSDLRQALRGGTVRLFLVFRVSNPNGYALRLSRIAYSGHLGGVRIAEGEHPEEVVLEPGREGVVKAPVELIPSAFRDALLKSLQKRALDYEFNGSLAVRAPVAGLLRIPFSAGGRLDAEDLLRAAGVAPF